MINRKVWGFLMLLCIFTFASCSEDDSNGMTNGNGVYLTINERQYTNELTQEEEIGTYFDGYADALGFGGCFLSASMNVKGDFDDFDDFIVEIAPISEFDIEKGMTFPNDKQDIAVEYLMYSGVEGAIYTYQSGSINITSKKDDDENRKSVIMVKFNNLVMEKESNEDRYSSYPEQITINGNCSYRQLGFNI